MAATSIRQLVGKAVRRFKRTLRTARYGNPEAPRPPFVSGVVEEFGPTGISGWVSVPAGAAPTAITLCLGDLDVASTYATSSPIVRSGAAGFAPVPSGVGALRRIAPQLRRNSWQEIRPFALHLDDVWRFAGRKTTVSVRVGDQALPIAGRGMYVLPAAAGNESLDALRAKFAEGYIFSQYGKLQLSKKLDRDWQRRASDIYAAVRTIVREEFGHDVFLVYGTLLGAVREGGLLAHDVDFDSAFIATADNGPAAVDELYRIGLRLVEHGLHAQIWHTSIGIRHPEDPDGVRVDLFHLFFDADGLLRFPFGVASTSQLPRTEWRGTREIDFLGRPALVPTDAERLVAHMYGESWREPKPGFDWTRERTTRAEDADATGEMRMLTRWARFYTHHDPQAPSLFAEYVERYLGAPFRIVDLGCGNGRDALHFARNGHDVLGIDVSEVAIRHAVANARSAQLDDRIRFELLDLVDVEQLYATLDDHPDGKTLYYLRFLLQAVTQPTQHALLTTLRDVARPGDVLAAEFRTLEDKTLPKTFTGHYRRFIDAGEFTALLLERYGFAVRDEADGTGLAPWGQEDPYVHRVIAVRMDAAT